MQPWLDGYLSFYSLDEFVDYRRETNIRTYNLTTEISLYLQLITVIMYISLIEFNEMHSINNDNLIFTILSQNYTINWRWLNFPLVLGWVC